MSEINHKNNFDILRVVASLTVVYTHSYYLSVDLSKDVFFALTKNNLELGYIAIKCFFTISGFLIFQSLNRSKTYFSFGWKRFLRIYPALTVVLLLCTIGLWPTGNLSFTEYFSNKSTYEYLFTNLTILKTRFCIKGIFEQNPAGCSINGSIWSLTYEVIFYFVLSFFFFFKKYKKLTFSLLLILFLVLQTASCFYDQELMKINTIFSLSKIADLGAYFLSGCLLSFVNFENYKYKNVLGWISFFLFIASIAFNFYLYTQFIFLPLATIAYGTSYHKASCNFIKRIGDLSYGVFIISFPIQQILMRYFPLKPIPLFIYSVLLVLPLSYFSWHLIEKRALQLKNKF